MIQIVVKPATGEGKPFTYTVIEYAIKGDFIEFLDKYDDRRTIHVSQLVEIIERGGSRDE